MKTLYHTNFAVAVNWCNNALVLCNNIPQIDDSIWDNFEPIVDLGYEPEYDEEGDEIFGVTIRESPCNNGVSLYSFGRLYHIFDNNFAFDQCGSYSSTDEKEVRLRAYSFFGIK